MIGNNSLSMLADFYEFTMSAGFFENGQRDTIAYFDMFFRQIPDDGGYVISAGLESLIKYLKALRFSPDDVAYLRGLGMFSEEYLAYLRDFKFECDVWAVPEGTPVFPNEPIVTVRGPVIQAQLLETMVLLIYNHQSLIATKARRIALAADGRAVMEFGSRRAQGYSAAVLGARAATIGGCEATACTLAAKEYNITPSGTMAHSWVQLFDDEYTAFKTYAQQYPDACTLLVDTYNVLKSGVSNAIRVFDEVLKPQGKRPVGIRLDSGDIAYLSRKARKMLDDAGYSDCKIIASNSLDEYIIRELLSQHARVDVFGVGERLITSKSAPILGGVYKLVAIENAQGNLVSKIKISENVAKITTPGFKELYRLYSRETGQAIADVITLRGEEIDDTRDYEIFDPEHTWKRKTVSDFFAKKLMVPVFENGKCVYTNPSVGEIKVYCNEQMDSIWEEVQRFENPHRYYVDLSQKLWDIKQQMLTQLSK